MLEPLAGIAIIEELEQDKSGLYTGAATNGNLQGKVIAVSAEPQVLADGVQKMAPVKPGDMVVYQKYANQEFRDGGKNYQLVKFDNILARIKE